MNIEPELERKVIDKFIVKERRERYLSLIFNPKFNGGLCHFSQELDKGLFSQLHKAEKQAILEKIKEKGDFKDCYLISESLNLDAKRMKIEEALATIVGKNIGTFIVFGAAQVVYYEGESPKDRWLSN